jgi:hypothetical protein
MSDFSIVQASKCVLVDNTDSTRAVKRARRDKNTPRQTHTNAEQYTVRTGKFSVCAVALDVKPESILLDGNPLAANIEQDQSYMLSPE